MFKLEIFRRNMARSALIFIITFTVLLFSSHFLFLKFAPYNYESIIIWPSGISEKRLNYLTGAAPYIIKDKNEVNDEYILTETNSKVWWSKAVFNNLKSDPPYSVISLSGNDLDIIGIRLSYVENILLFAYYRSEILNGIRDLECHTQSCYKFIDDMRIALKRFQNQNDLVKRLSNISDDAIRKLSDKEEILGFRKISIKISNIAKPTMGDVIITKKGGALFKFFFGLFLIIIWIVYCLYKACSKSSYEPSRI